MRRLHKKVSKKSRLPPGSIVYIGTARSHEVSIEVIDYTESKVVEKIVSTPDECLPFRDQNSITWINITGIHDTHIVAEIGKHFGLHPLVVEDVANTNSRPKVEDFDHYMFILLKMLSYDSKSREVGVEQVSFIVSDKFVITFQETKGDSFDSIRRRIREGKGRVRKQGSDYLFYALVDVIVDDYFNSLDRLGDDIEDLEETLEDRKSHEVLNEIRHLKHELILLRKNIIPLREVLSNIIRSETPLIKKSTRPYLRDVLDHVNQVIDTIKSFRDVVSGLLQVHLAIMSNKMNEIVKVLTIISTIFIPLTFIVGVYGMNFAYFPELGWKWSYPIVWLVMLSIAGVMLMYFRKNEWI